MLTIISMNPLSPHSFATVPLPTGAVPAQGQHKQRPLRSTQAGRNLLLYVPSVEESQHPGPSATVSATVSATLSGCRFFLLSL